MSRRGREGAPSDDVLLEALDRLVESEGIVEAGERLGVNYRTAAKCLEERRVSRRMRQALEQHLREQTEQPEEHEQNTAASAAGEPGGGDGRVLQESEQALRGEVEALRAEVVDLRERVAAVEDRVARGSEARDNRLGAEGVEDVDIGDAGQHRRPVAPPRRIFPELITEVAEAGEEQVYGAAAELVVEWRGAWAERKRAPYTLDWLRAERRRLDLELRLIGVFGLTPPPADAPWRERRREREVDWRRRVLWRLRWQIPLTWGLHWLLRLLTLGLWGRAKGH